MMPQRDKFQKDVEYIQSQFQTEFTDMQLWVSGNDPGDGQRFCLELYHETKNTLLMQGNYYSKSEFDSMLTGLKQFAHMIDKAEKERKRD